MLDDYLTAPIDEKVRAMLGFLKKMALEPEALGASDVATLRRAGLDDPAIYEAIHVGYVFNGFDRLADALGFDLPTDGYAMAPKFLLTFGYR